MVNTITVKKADGTIETIKLHEVGVEQVIIECDHGMRVDIGAPEAALDAAHVHTWIDSTYKVRPAMYMTIGEYSGEYWQWRADAMMYATENGRIVGKNQTEGYASTEKPLAPKPYEHTKGAKNSATR